DLYRPMIRYILKSSPVIPSAQLSVESSPSNESEGVSELPSISEYKIADLIPEDQSISCVLVNDPLDNALTEMLLHDYSQLVVEDWHRKYVGIISLKTVVSKLWHEKPQTVKDCIDQENYSVPSDTEVGQALSIMGERNVAVVIDKNGLIKGIVTTHDIATDFARLVGPFRRLEEIENRLGRMIATKFSPKELHDALRSEDTANETLPISELSFGEMIRLLQSQFSWDWLGTKCDRIILHAELDWALNIRNSLMHFRDFPTTTENKRLFDLMSLLRKLPDSD
ncbi:MAG: CBS domain-containing protein, partial [Chloroflexi bacterium]|nr:CBS domain-containing protein [Chloroflexota bacterium]